MITQHCHDFSLYQHVMCVASSYFCHSAKLKISANHCHVLRYTVFGSGDGSSVILRVEPSMNSAEAGSAPKGAEVRVDKVHEVDGEKLRAHICESRGKLKSPSGWTTAMLLCCQSGVW